MKTINIIVITFLALFAIFLLYVLSIGPVSWLAAHGHIPNSAYPWIQDFYHPFIWVLTDEDGWAMKVYMWYISFWVNISTP